MPYLIVKQGNKHCVYKENSDGEKTGPTLGCHPTVGAANKQLAALNASVTEGIMENFIQTDHTEPLPEVETTVGTTAEESYPAYDMMDKANVPWGATSFADVAAAREATQMMERLEGHTSVFYTLFWRIWRDSDVPMSEKTSAWRALVDDFFDAFNTEMAVEANAMAEFEEMEFNTGSVINISESDKSNADNRAPLKMDIVVIEPGWGNPKDNHYYPAEVLRRDAHIFEGAKMYATDHRQEEKSVRTEVAKVEKIIKFSETGAPIARVKVWNPDFAEDIRNRDKMGELDTLKCSILAMGRAKKGKIDDRDANIVEAILPSTRTNVDFVTNAGAGGHALQLVEMEKEVHEMDVQEDDKVDETTEKEELEEVILHEQDESTEEESTEMDETEVETSETDESEDETVEEVSKDEPTLLTEAEVSEVLDSSKLDEFTKSRLAKIQYTTVAELENDIKAEIDHITALIGSGQPRELGETGSAVKQLSEQEIIEDHNKRMDAIIRG